MRNYFTVIIAILVLGCGQKKLYDLAIENVGFFDGKKDHGILNLGINSDRIAITTVDQILSDSVINGSGKYIIPGLVNSHVHIWEAEQLKASYDSGILAQIGMHTSNVEKDKTIKEIGRGKDYPYYFTSGFAATVPNGHPSQISSNPIETINDSVSISQWVDHRINENVDFIKIIIEIKAEFRKRCGLQKSPTFLIREH